MQLEHAEHTLETIRTLMERSQRYEHISGYSGLVAGAVTILGCVVLRLNLLPLAFPANFAVVWSTVFAVAFAGHLLLTFGRARQRGEPVWSRQARTVLLAVFPAFGAALMITVLIWRFGRPDLLPGALAHVVWLWCAGHQLFCPAIDCLAGWNLLRARCRWSAGSPHPPNFDHGHRFRSDPHRLRSRRAHCRAARIARPRVLGADRTPGRFAINRMRRCNVTRQ